jgi:hypothetical protein
LADGDAGNQGEIKMAHGGKRGGAGRPAGRRNRATLEQKASLEDLARQHTETALSTLVQIAQASESDAARVSAATAILDRGYGRPRQAVEHSGPEGGSIPVDATVRIEFVRPKKDANDPDA